MLVHPIGRLKPSIVTVTPTNFCVQQGRVQGVFGPNDHRLSLHSGWGCHSKVNDLKALAWVPASSCRDYGRLSGHERGRYLESSRTPRILFGKMASSFSSQIPLIVWLLEVLRPHSILDVGKGFGKYGFLSHEYLGVDAERRPDPTRTLADQSRIVVDAVESNRDYLWPHIAQFYRHVFVGRAEDLCGALPTYDLVLMCDVIEHLTKDAGLTLLGHFIARGSTVIVSTPKDFFQQTLYESADEMHISHWTPRDFRLLHAWIDWQTVDAGRIYLLSPRALDTPGFGRGPLKRMKRIARAIRDEILS